MLGLNPGWPPADGIQHVQASADKLDSRKLVCTDGNRLNLCRAVEGPLSLVAPADGAILHVARLTPIRWANAYPSARLDKVKIEFSPDDGATWPVTLVAATRNDGRWDWTPGPRHRTRHGRIRVTPVAGNFPKVSGSFRVILGLTKDRQRTNHRSTAPPIPPSMP